jgi:hypothetical protein
LAREESTRDLSSTKARWVETEEGLVGFGVAGEGLVGDLVLIVLEKGFESGVAMGVGLDLCGLTRFGEKGRGEKKKERSRKREVGERKS